MENSILALPFLLLSFLNSSSGDSVMKMEETNKQKNCDGIPSSHSNDLSPDFSGIQPTELCRKFATPSLAHCTTEPQHLLHHKMASFSNIERKLKFTHPYVPAAQGEQPIKPQPSKLGNYT